ncbi:MAG: hypothetical protein Q9195_002072 [Heterodermia aff. obscurata]
MQSLICLHEDITYLRADIQTWIRFRLSSSRQHLKFGQITRSGVEWSFYELAKLKRCIVGQENDARYVMLVKVLFCIQKLKQDRIDGFKLSYNNGDSLGIGSGRLTDTPDVMNYIRNMMLDEEDEEDEQDEESDDSD